MKCPVCKSVDLAMTERQGVEIDYCPTCRGVWLDRGELDKIIQRANDWEAGRDASATPPHGDPVLHNQHGTRHGPPPVHSADDPVGADFHGDQRKRKPFWLELFD